MVCEACTTIDSSKSLIQDVRKTIATFFARLDIPCKAIPFDGVLEQECVDEARRRGYSMNGTSSVQTYLHECAAYAAATCAHLPHRPTQIWAALYFSCILFVDDAMTRFPLERTNIYQFNRRFFRGQVHGNDALDALADLLHQVPDLFRPMSSNLVVTSTLNFVTANLLEHETKNLQISGAAQRYATYQRMMATAPEAFVFMVFPREIPVKDYIQALPEMMLFFNNTNDILSFYKEELAGETTNQISLIAARDKTSKLNALNELANMTADIFDRAVEILNGSPAACETFKKFANGFTRFHVSVERYRLTDLELE